MARGRTCRWSSPAFLTFMLMFAVGADGASTPPDTVASVLSAPAVELRLLEPGLRRIELDNTLIEPASLSVLVSGEAWLAERDWRLDARRGIWIPLREIPAGPPLTAVFRYRHLPAPIPDRMELNPVVTRPAAAGSLATARSVIGAPRGAIGADTGDLEVRGSKTVRMASGSRRELTVDQTLRLDISGRLTEDITVQAVLSDDDLPVVPEGNTEELRDIDRVRVDVMAPSWRAVLGDFVARREGTVFGDYRRKLQGASVSGTGTIRADVLAGAPRGRYRTIQFRGQESNQGPYPLGADGGANLFLVAGSERVELDGERLVRGADRDYVVDYVRGTITFTYRRLVTAESEIVVEFEEGEGPYARAVSGGGAGADVDLPVAGPARFAVRMIREGDDPDRPRFGELSDDDRAVLEDAGDDPEQAVTGGITPAAPGEGRYRLEDVDGVQVAVWDTVLGDVDVVFRHVGSGFGDYGVESLTATGETVYEYRGPGGGSWSIGRLLEMPDQHRLFTAQAAVGDTTAPWLAAEWHLSDFDANVLSSRDDGDDRGRAWRADLRSGERDVGLGTAAVNAVHEGLGSGFRPFVLSRDLFRYDRWGLGLRARRDGFLEEAEAYTRVESRWRTGDDERRRASLTGVWDRLRHGAALEAHALEAEAAWNYGRFGGRHTARDAAADDAVDPLDVTGTRRQHRLEADLGAVRVMGGRHDAEDVDAAATAGVRGHRLRRWLAELAAGGSAPWQWRLGWSRDLADSSRADGWRRERDGRTLDWSVAGPPVAGVRLSFVNASRRTEIPEGSDLTTRLAKLRLTGRWPDLGSDWGLVYGVDNSRTEVLDRQVVYVGLRQGDYNEAGDFVGREQGDYRVVTVGTDSLVATTEVVADLTWRQDFGVLGADRWWGGWSTYTRLTARGRSRSDDVGSLLRLSRGAVFAPDDAVVGEYALRQDVNLLRHLKAWDLRLRYEFDELLDRQYAAHPERRLRRLHQGTLVRNLGRATTLRWRTRREGDRRATEEVGFVGNRPYRTTVWRHELETAWRPGPGNQLTLSADVRRRRDAVTDVAQREWGMRPSVRWRLADRWNGVAELRWSTVTSDEPPGVLRPFFFPYPGANVDATTRLTWSPGRSMTVTLAHFSRRLGDERGWQHDVRLESTARF